MICFANMMLCSVSAPADLRFAENAIPTWEKRRSTEADDAGQPRYCRRSRRARAGSALWGALGGVGRSAPLLLNRSVNVNAPALNVKSCLFFFPAV